MSLDVYLCCPHCGQSVFHGNYTYNAGPMWRRAVDDNNAYMVNIDGLSGKASIDILSRVILAMSSDMKTYRAMNPENGWGDADSFLVWIRSLQSEAENHPDFVWECHR